MIQYYSRLCPDFPYNILVSLVLYGGQHGLWSAASRFKCWPHHLLTPQAWARDIISPNFIFLHLWSGANSAYFADWCDSFMIEYAKPPTRCFKTLAPFWVKQDSWTLISNSSCSGHPWVHMAKGSKFSLMDLWLIFCSWHLYQYVIIVWGGSTCYRYSYTASPASFEWRLAINDRSSEVTLGTRMIFQLKMPSVLEEGWSSISRHETQLCWLAKE